MEEKVLRDNGVCRKVERYSCSRCKYHTVSKRQLQRHIKQKHSPGKYVCGECGEKFHRPLMFKLHMTTHTNDNEHSCPVCKKTFPLVSMLKIHQETHSTESIHPCPHCSKQFRQKSALSKHVAFGHTKKNVHPCSICGKIFPSPSTLLLHMEANHKNKKSNKIPTGDATTSASVTGPMTRRLRFYHRPNDQNMFKCQRCQRKFFTSYALAKHMEGHHGFQTQKCVECNLDFKTKKALYRHMAMHVHGCDECGKKFRTQDQLETHKKLHSRTELTCNLCGRNFSKGISYRRHMDAHAHNPKYQCPECGKNFRRQADLQTHQWLHKGDGFPCEDCAKKFGTKQHLIWHSYIHYVGKKSDSDIKQEKSETDMVEETVENEVKSEKISGSGSESNSQNATSKEAIMKEKPKVACTNKANTPDAKDKKKSKRPSPSPVKKGSSTVGANPSNNVSSPGKKTNVKQDDLKIDDVKIKKERIDESKSKQIDNSEKKQSASPAKAGKPPKKACKKKSKGKRKSRKTNGKSSEEPTATDTDSKVVTGTESERDALADKQQNEKILTTEEVLLSDDVLQDSNELHDEKELRVDTVMFDDIDEENQLDINAAIETLTKLGNHAEHEVAPDTFDNVEVIEEELEQADKDINEADLVGLEDIANIDTTEKAISRVDIQSLYDMETDNDTAGETEALDAAKATVFRAMQANAESANHAQMDTIIADDEVITDTSTMLIESEIATQADRLIQTGLYVQNVMGTQDCNVLEAIETAVQQVELMGLEVNAQVKSVEALTNNLQVQETENGSTTQMVVTQTDASNMDITEVGELRDTSAMDAGLCQNVSLPTIAMSCPEVVHYPGEQSTKAAISAGNRLLVVPASKAGNGRKSESLDQCDINVNKVIEFSAGKSTVESEEKSNSVQAISLLTGITSDQENNSTYLVYEERISEVAAHDKIVSGKRKGKDGQVSETKICSRGHAIDSEHVCVGGCSKCSAEFGLRINKTLCPHSKELKVLIEKLDFKACPVGDNGEVMLSVSKSAAEAVQQAQKLRLANISENTSPPTNTTDVSVTKVPNKSTVGMSRLRRRIHHSSSTKNASTKCCDTRRKELNIESPMLNQSTELDLVASSPSVITRSTRSCTSRLPARTLRTTPNPPQQPVKDWRKPPPSVEKKHGRKFTSALRRKSESDQLSPTPQYTVSALNDLTIRITTQSSPETSPSQQKKSPSSKESSNSKSSKTQEKEDSALRHMYGATQELCVIVDDINELVLLQQERLRKLKNCKPVKLAKKVDDLKKRHRSNDLSADIDTAPKPIKLLLRLPKERIRKHEKRLALLDKRMSYNSNSADANESMEYQQPDSSQDMLNKAKARLQGPEDSIIVKTRPGVRSEDSVGEIVGKNISDNMRLVDDNVSLHDRAQVSPNSHVIGSVLSLSNSVLSVEECDSTSMAETQRHAYSTPGEIPNRRVSSRRKEMSPNKEEPLDLTVRYMDVKPDPDRVYAMETDPDETDEDYCNCCEENCEDGCKTSGHVRPNIKVKDDPERDNQLAGGSNGSGGMRCPTVFASSDPLHVGYVNSASSLTSNAIHTQEAEQETETPTEYIEVIDRGIQCELGDELLFMPQVPQPIAD